MTATCTVTYATTGECGKPAVVTFGKYGECAEHYVPAPAKAEVVPVKAKAPRYCRKVACVEAALGYEFVAHLAGTCR